MAEIIFKNLLLISGLQWIVDSAGTSGWHEGEDPDPRTISACKKAGFSIIDIPKARKIRQSDFTEFDYILCMDESNYYDVKRIVPTNSTAKIALLGKFDPEGLKEVQDPYYGNIELFYQIFTQIRRCLEQFLNTFDKVSYDDL